MKKLICILLALTFILMIGSASFAASGDTTVTDPNIPRSPARTVDSETYRQQTVEIIDNELPAGGASALPRTGGIPAEAFYATGALLVVAAIILSRKTARN